MSPGQNHMKYDKGREWYLLKSIQANEERYWKPSGIECENNA